VSSNSLGSCSGEGRHIAAVHQIHQIYTANRAKLLQHVTISGKALTNPPAVLTGSSIPDSTSGSPVPGHLWVNRKYQTIALAGALLDPRQYSESRSIDHLPSLYLRRTGAFNASFLISGTFYHRKKSRESRDSRLATHNTQTQQKFRVPRAMPHATYILCAAIPPPREDDFPIF
jgi:hypothetical protein